VSACVICEHHDHEQTPVSPANGPTPQRYPDIPQQREKPCTSRCRRREATEGAACQQCAATIRRDLDEILECHALTDEPSAGQRSGGARSSERSLPGGTDRLNWRADDLHRTLTAWCADWAERWRLKPPAPHLTSITGFLRTHLPNALTDPHPAISDFAAEISRLARVGRRLASLTQPGTLINCPGPAGAGCGQRLRVNAADPDAIHRCRACGTNWTPAWLLTLATHCETPVWVDVEVAAKLSGVHESTLHRWANKGKIKRDHGRYEIRSIRSIRHAATRRSA
jgi:hypothetical protein